jgi:hypothetical protein
MGTNSWIPGGGGPTPNDCCDAIDIFFDNPVYTNVQTALTDALFQNITCSGVTLPSIINDPL